MIEALRSTVGRNPRGPRRTTNHRRSVGGPAAGSDVCRRGRYLTIHQEGDAADDIRRTDFGRDGCGRHGSAGFPVRRVDQGQEDRPRGQPVGRGQQPGSSMLRASQFRQASSMPTRHSDGALLVDGQHANGIRQGITTEIICPDGLGYAPLSREGYRMYRQYLSGILGLPPEDLGHELDGGVKGKLSPQDLVQRSDVRRPRTDSRERSWYE